MKILPLRFLLLWTWTLASPLFAAVGTARADEPAKLLEVRKVWDQAPHNAFTDLVRFQDRWYCVFREGKSHVWPDGALRVVASADGVKWRSAALLTSPDSDLRDAKITVTPDGRLMLSGAEAMHDRSRKSHQSLVWFSRRTNVEPAPRNRRPQLLAMASHLARRRQVFDRLQHEPGSQPAFDLALYQRRRSDVQSAGRISCFVGKFAGQKF